MQLIVHRLPCVFLPASEIGGRELLPQGLLSRSSCPARLWATSVPTPAVCGGTTRGASALRNQSAAIPPLPPPIQTVCKTNPSGSGSGVLLGCHKHRGRNISSRCALRWLFFWPARPPCHRRWQLVSTAPDPALWSRRTKAAESRSRAVEQCFSSLPQPRDHRQREAPSTSRSEALTCGLPRPSLLLPLPPSPWGFPFSRWIKGRRTHSQTFSPGPTSAEGCSLQRTRPSRGHCSDRAHTPIQFSSCSKRAANWFCFERPEVILVPHSTCCGKYF